MRRLASLGIAIVALFLVACGEQEPGIGPPEAGANSFNGDRAYRWVERQIEIGPRPAGSEASRRLTIKLARELRRLGLDRVGISGTGVIRNVVGTIPGTEDGFVVIGAHHDTKDGIPGFVGANDGGSGVAVVLELARIFAVDAPLEGPSIVVALFDAEESRGTRSFSEDGMRGSRDFVAQAGEGGGGAVPPLEQIEAMVLFDMVGDCDLQIPRERNSSEELYGAFAAADPELFAGETGPIDDDHVPFLQAGVPSVDLIDFTFGGDETPGRFWHTPDDTLDKVCAESLDRVGEAALRAIPALP